MTDVTRTYYTNRINTRVRAYPAGRSPAVNSTDISRASAAGIGATQPANLPVMSQNEIDGNVDPFPAPIVGTDVRDILQSKATTWSYVRKLRYELDGNQGNNAQYTRYAYLTSPALGSSVPPTSSPVFYPLNAGEDIDQADFNAILDTLRIIVNAAAVSEYPSVIHYCHSQCHYSCHGSRGRR